MLRPSSPKAKCCNCGLPRNLAIGETHYLNVISAKTAALFAAAAEAGAMPPAPKRVQTEAMRSYGHNLGIAFQLVDDALDYSGRQAVMGKSVGDDFREAKMTLAGHPVAARAPATRNAASGARPSKSACRKKAIFRAPSNFWNAAARLAETIERARGYARAAQDSLHVCPDSDIKSALADIAGFRGRSRVLSGRLCATSIRTGKLSRRHPPIRMILAAMRSAAPRAKLMLVKKPKQVLPLPDIAASAQPGSRSSAFSTS